MNTAITTSRENRIKANIGYLHIDDAGTGGIPVVFAHSFGGTLHNWAAQLEHLRENRRAIAFDLRGHGLSDAPSDNNYDVALLAEDIATIADSLELEKFMLVGHSMGGSAVIAYAGLHPERVAGLMMVGTPGKSGEDVSKPIIASLESEQYQQVMDSYMKQLTANAKPDVNQEVMEGVNSIPRVASIEIIKAIFRFDPLPSLRKYPGPKMIVTATSEDQPNSLHKSFPEIPHKVINGTSHWVQMDKPEEFNRLLDEFLLMAERRH